MAERCEQEQKKQKIEKAKARKRMWREWRNKDSKVSRAEPEGEETREIPGHDNTLHKADEISEKLRGEESGCRGAYEKILRESTAHCNAGPHNPQEGEALDAEEEVLHQVQAEVLHQEEAETEDRIFHQRAAEAVMGRRNGMEDEDEAAGEGGHGPG